MSKSTSPIQNLSFGTISFAVCFAAWGLISAFAPTFQTQFGLSGKSTAFLIAVPVLLGSIARIPMGMLTDRFGGRAMFAVLFAAVALSAAIVPSADSYSSLIACAFLLGLAGSSFTIGIGFVARWFPPEKQGTALGVYGLGNIGHSAAVFLGPVAASQVGRDTVFFGAALLVLAWGVVFYLFARNAPVTHKQTRFRDMISILATERLSWVLSAFYFLTFGGFVAFSIYLPTLLRDEFELTITDAGLRTAAFVIVATFSRPFGGMLSDRIGGVRVLSAILAGIIPFSLLLTWSAVLPFTVGALGCAVLLGIGNGAVFKLVPQFFPNNTATVTGLVGAMGGLGGFFPPLLLGFLRDRAGVVWPGFVLLAATSGVLWMLSLRVFASIQKRAHTIPEPMSTTAAVP